MSYTSPSKRNLLLVIMDGVGCTETRFGNAVALAHTPTLDFLKRSGLYTQLNAHGTYVGLPTDQDIGNSEVGHNTIGAGRTLPQGATLVNQAIKEETLYQSDTWKAIMQQVCQPNKTLHFIGLLSDGNVHSHEKHLHDMLEQAHRDQVKSIRVHVLFDGRDVAPKSAETYIARLENILTKLRQNGCDARAASAGGRMSITMDRYQADWMMVKKGWDTHTLGLGIRYKSLLEGLQDLRKKNPLLGDQDLPPFVIAEDNKPVGTIEDGDGVICFNFRGDRAIEISQAFTDKDFPYFDRTKFPQVYYAGLLEYDADRHVPRKFLLKPPPIKNSLGEYMCKLGVKQFACSETQKYGHVTYFWNGNHSGYIDRKLEDYCEIPSDNLSFDLKPWMKAYEITEKTIEALSKKQAQFLRINFPNGDMVGHTGNLQATILAMNAVDLMLNRLLVACKKTETILMVTADHGNCEEMFRAKEKDYPLWEQNYQNTQPPPKTSHTLSQVPFYVFDPRKELSQITVNNKDSSLANIANTILSLMGLTPREDYESSLLKKK